MSARPERMPDTDDARHGTIVSRPGVAREQPVDGGDTSAGAVVVLPGATTARQPAGTTPTRAIPSPQREGVHVAPNLHELVTAAPRATPEDVQAAKERRDLNEVVHSVLIVGLVISTALMLIGVGLDLFYRQDLPPAVPKIGDVIGRVWALRPSGFLALGLLVLIATPILRVVGSIGAFLYERDWRFAGVTTLVLMVLIVSLLLGRG